MHFHYDYLSEILRSSNKCEGHHLLLFFSFVQPALIVAVADLDLIYLDGVGDACEDSEELHLLLADSFDGIRSRDLQSEIAFCEMLQRLLKVHFSLESCRMCARDLPLDRAVPRRRITGNRCTTNRLPRLS